MTPADLPNVGHAATALLWCALAAAAWWSVRQIANAPEVEPEASEWDQRDGIGR